MVLTKRRDFVKTYKPKVTVEYNKDWVIGGWQTKQTGQAGQNQKGPAKQSPHGVGTSLKDWP